jgi:tol-pal system protein YbgF
MLFKSWLLGGMLVLQIAVANAAPSIETRSSAQAVRSVEDRIAQMERALNPVRLEALSQLEALQQEMRALRGLVEEQDHQLKQLAKSQQNLFLNLEKRLDQMQSSSHKPSSKKLEKPPVAPPAPAVPSPSELPLEPLPEPMASTDEFTPLPVPAALLETESATPPPVAAALPQAPENNLAPIVEPAASTPKEAFLKAYALVKNKQYPEAIQGLGTVIDKFPQGEYTATSFYWLGEVYMTQWQSDHSVLDLLAKSQNAFNTVAQKFPNHPKAADSFLKLGLIEIEKENWSLANQYLSTVTEKYADTAPARMAEVRLEQLRQEGRI